MAILWPSGERAASYPSIASGSMRPPPAGIQPYVAVLWSASADGLYRNRIRSPSGDHIGSSYKPRSDVTRRTSVPLRALVAVYHMLQPQAPTQSTHYTLDQGREVGVRDDRPVRPGSTDERQEG